MINFVTIPSATTTAVAVAELHSGLPVRCSVRVHLATGGGYVMLGGPAVSFTSGIRLDQGEFIDIPLSGPDDELWAIKGSQSGDFVLAVMLTPEG